MTQPKHTPGPWQRNISSRYPIYSEKTEGEKDWQYIASIPQGERANTTEEEREANYLLIAAAPELLAALEDIVNHKGAGISEEAYRKADKAINKAKGL